MQLTKKKMGWGMEQKQLYENHYKDCAVSSHMQLTKKNGVWDGQKQLYENHFKDCAVFSVCLGMTLREPPEFLTP